MQQTMSLSIGLQSFDQFWQYLSPDGLWLAYTGDTRTEESCGFGA